MILTSDLHRHRLHVGIEPSRSGKLCEFAAAPEVCCVAGPIAILHMAIGRGVKGCTLTCSLLLLLCASGYVRLELCYDRNESDYKDLIEKYHSDLKAKGESCTCNICLG